MVGVHGVLAGKLNQQRSWRAGAERTFHKGGQLTIEGGQLTTPYFTCYVQRSCNAIDSNSANKYKLFFRSQVVFRF